MSPTPKRAKLSPTVPSTLHEDDTGESAACGPSKRTSLENFFTLPHEIKVSVIKLACSRILTSPSASPSSTPSHASAAAHPPASPGKPTCSALPLIDGANALSLILVSRSLYALVAPLIWESAWLTRPSQVASFHSAIAARPQLGRLVKSLHVGPDDELPDWWWPLVDQENYTDRDSSSSAPPPHVFIRSSFQHPEDTPLRPDWCMPDEDWALENRPDENCGRAAVYDALTVVQDALDVNLLDPGTTRSKKVITCEAWTTRLYEAQAALDLYLMALRRIDDKDQDGELPRSCGCRWGKCPTYPPVIFRDSYMPFQKADEKPTSSAAPLVLSRHQLHRHLSRPGSITDRLDHPLFFERSGVTAVGRASHYGSERWRRHDEADEMPEDFADLFAPEDGRRVEEYRTPCPTSCEVLDPTLPNTATFGSILTLVRSILSFTPFLTNLSLTGFLDRAVCGSKPTASSLRHLRHLTVGPPPSAWFAPLRFDWLRHLESLRICGVEVQDDEAESINGLPDLRHFSWSMAAKWDDKKGKPG